MNGITTQLDHLARHLEINSARHQVASSNIANVNTPGFTASQVVASLDTPQTAGANSQAAFAIAKQDGKARMDGNNVDIDKELGQLKKSALQHRVFTQLVSTKVRQLRSAMSKQ